MKKALRLTVAAVLMAVSLPSYSQFHTVKKIPYVMNITTSDTAPAAAVLPKDIEKEMQIRPEAQSDSITASVTDSTVVRNLMCPPLDSLTVTSHYGYRKDPFTGKRKFHYGTDFRSNSENVYAMMPGKVKKIGYNKKLGNYITLEHGEFEVTYAHLHTAVGEKGDFVNAGQSVGITGSTGRSTGEHLHVAMRFRKKSVDPYPLVMYVKNHSYQGM